MKGRLLAIAVVVGACACAQGGTLVQWNFNSPLPDGDVSTGTLAPSIGSGAASTAGGITNLFMAGDTADDPASSSDNSACETKSYPSSTNNNKPAGVRFDASTDGYENISISWCQRNTSTASRYARLQYTLDGTTFLDAEVITMSADSVFTNQMVNLGAVPEVADNPSFGFRIVTEFESTATGSGTNAYVATAAGSSYRTTGTMSFDMVTVSGTAIADGNTPPYVTYSIDDQTLRPNQTSSPLPFLVLDAESPASELALKGVSSDASVISDADIAFGGSGAQRTVAVTAGTHQGLCRVTVWVIDPGGKSNSLSFAVTVLAANLPPLISGISRTNTLVNVPTPVIRFTISDPESPASGLILSAISANPALVPNTPGALALGGSGSNRTIAITPAPGQAGVAPIAITVSDGTNTASTPFPLMVLPSTNTLFYEPFAYPDGSLLTNSAFLWDHRSGTFGQCQVVSGQLQVTAAQTEDVIGPLTGGPYTTGNGTVLYASFQVKFLSMPGYVPGCFAHFGNGSNLRGRICAGTSNAPFGFFHLFVANGSDAVSTLAWNLSLNTSYTVVLRYALDTPSSTLCLNPTSEADTGVAAADSATAISIASFGFRQDADVGAAMLIDELRVGTSFSAVTSPAAPGPVPLNILCNGCNVILSWTNSAFLLQAAPAANGIYTNVPAAASPFTNALNGPARFFRLKTSD